MANLAIVVNGQVTGALGIPNVPINFVYANTSSPGEFLELRLTTTLASVVANLPGAAYPANCRFVLVIPPAGNTTNILVAGAAGQTAAIYDGTQPFIVPIPASGQVLFIASALGTIDVQLGFL